MVVVVVVVVVAAGLRSNLFYQHQFVFAGDWVVLIWQTGQVGSVWLLGTAGIEAG